MIKRVYISADYSENDGDRSVIDELHRWGQDQVHKVYYVDTAEVRSGSVSANPDCRACDLKLEFNRQINASSAVIFVIGDKTSSRTAGSECERNSKPQNECMCTPYKQNANGQKQCKVYSTVGAGEDIGNINPYSYLKHEFMQAKKRGKTIIVIYNALNKQSGWLPSYMTEYESAARPFWKWSNSGEKVGDYSYIKQALGYE